MSLVRQACWELVSNHLFKSQLQNVEITNTRLLESLDMQPHHHNLSKPETLSHSWLVCERCMPTDACSTETALHRLFKAALVHSLDCFHVVCLHCRVVSTLENFISWEDFHRHSSCKWMSTKIIQKFLKPLKLLVPSIIFQPMVHIYVQET